ncbi:hypothetical protein BJX99DRAFT_255347 [Aspergillus californicus]
MASTGPTARQKKATQQISLQRLINEHNIHFYPIGDRLPASLEREDAAVRAIADATKDVNLKRSSQVTQERVEGIWEAVRWCLKNEHNEDDWRAEVETNILNPLTKHHACPQCGKRLWRADYEFPMGEEQGDRWENLGRRRDRRDKCACKSRILGDSRPRDRVFQTLRGSKVWYGPGLKDRVLKGIRPDLVVGLYNGPKLTTLLNAPSTANPAIRVGDLVKSDIFAKKDADFQDDSAMVFPFLILEAKRARAPDSLEDIERQMAFPAYEMLRAQNRVLENTTVSQASDRLPRVWLVSFKAQIWRLYVATTERDMDGKHSYNIYNVWSGDVSGKSDALKLVLLLDCVFDWALDIYRLDIFQSLRSMVRSNPRVTTSNVAPTVSDLSEALGGLGISDPITSGFGSLDTIHEDTQEDVLKYRHGWVRSARQALISGEGLLITATNIADIFDNFEHPDHAKRFARLIWELLMRDAWLFPSEAILDKVREVWTGEKDNRLQVPEVPIYVQLEVYAYFDINWQPTRKLIFVAVTEDSIPELFKRTKYVERRSNELEAPEDQIPERIFLAGLRDRRKPTLASDNLEEAISRWHCWLGSDLDKLSWRYVSVPSCDKAFQEIFRMYKVGQKEPSESFLKIWHSPQPIAWSEYVNEPQLIIRRTDRRDWRHIDPRNIAPTLCVFVFENLDDLGTSEIAETLGHYKEQWLLGGFYEYTVLRGKYFSGTTRFYDNRPESKWISRRKVASPSCVRRVTPSFLLDEWIRELREGEVSDSATDSDEEYLTDDHYHEDGEDGSSNEDGGSSNEADGSSDKDDGSSNEDGGSSNEDGGSSDEDGGSSNEDGGSSDEDDGSSNEDGGSSNEADGSSDEDGGSSNEDGGSSNEDGGSSDEDDGSSNEDGGSSNEADGSSDEDGGSSNEDGGSSDEDGGSSNEDGGSSSEADGSSDKDDGSSNEDGGSSNEADGSSNEDDEEEDGSSGEE